MPAVVGDVFGLGDVYIRQVSPVTVGIDTSGNFITVSGWSDLRSHGWFGGGATGLPMLSTVDRIDFSNDTGTASVRGPLSVAKYALAATGNSNYGWFAGGQAPTISTVDRVDFSNDSATASVRGPLSLARVFLAATGNSNYGWFGGGSTPTPARVSTVDRIDFSNDSATASVRGPLSLERSGLAGTGNSNYGWFGGGYLPTTVRSTVDRVDFSNDSATASVRGPLSLARNSLTATGNSNYGWFGGGSTPTPSVLTTVDRIDFSNDLTTASVRGSLSVARYQLAATGNSNYGWFGAGFNASIAVTSTVDRIDFSNDTGTASPRGPLSAAKYVSSATSGQARSSSTRLQKAGNFGWIGGNSYSVPPFTTVVFSTVDRIDFSNDSTTASPRGVLSAAKSRAAATGNSNYGWWGGGANPDISTVDRIDFSNDSATASVRGSLILQRTNLSATGNSNYGWYAGGFTPATPAVLSSRVERINFSNDLATASPRGNLIITTNQFGATGNSNYGWFGGGQAPGPPYIGYSYVQRIDFSNDLPTASPRGLLSASGYILAATGNSNYGWFGSRSRDGGSTATTRIDRINFSNDSVTASPRGLLNTQRKSSSATGNSNYGWWFGGTVSPGSLSAYSSVERIDFSNDSATASTRGNLTAIRSSSAATSNTHIG